ncbi:probable inactive shikimate kinase like 2, chloroplastic isoform X2 [Citrus sinensis]|uniref:probable inactive shikimate kinase like 2, chloroplastic isoform X2 n=1 Tax=Citrus sinensis TaxID=2711 RepID=UPI00227937C2|nr:probable inactive shikimate kinase like 2, chloroplastic isoform X2 [Citrus sinensis]
MAAAAATYHHLSLSSISQNPISKSKTQHFSSPRHSVSIFKPIFISSSLHKSTNVVPIKTHDRRRFTCSNSLSSIPANTSQYEFSDGSAEIELRLQLGSLEIQSSKDIFVDADGTCLTVRVNRSGSFITLIETNQLFDKIKPTETIWYIDEDQLVINLKKQDPELKWPDIVESWESLTAGSMQLLKGTSIFLVGDSTEVNEKVALELAVGLGYTPLSTKELLETFAKQTIDSYENSAKEEARRHVKDGKLGYSNADVVVKLQGWDADHAKSVAQASLSALKQLIQSDKKLPGKKSLYIRLGCRGDWPNIKPPGWDPSAGPNASTDTN